MSETNSTEFEEITNEEETTKEAKADPVEELETKASELANKLIKDDSGKLSLPEGVEVSPELFIAAKSIKRQRDTQSEYTKVRKASLKAETVNKSLTDYILQNASINLTEEQQEELEDLKINDPDEWRVKLAEYEENARKAHQSKISEFDAEGNKRSELEMRELKYKEFEESTGIVLNDSVVENDLPAAYSRDLEEGKITFDEFLNKARIFLTQGKVIKDAGKKDDPGTKNLSKLPGGHSPSKQAESKDAITSYNDEIY